LSFSHRPVSNDAFDHARAWFRVGRLRIIIPMIGDSYEQFIVREEYVYLLAASADKLSLYQTHVGFALGIIEDQIPWIAS
jgi:hypothetical protein